MCEEKTSIKYCGLTFDSCEVFDIVEEKYAWLIRQLPKNTADRLQVVGSLIFFEGVKMGCRKTRELLAETIELINKKGDEVNEKVREVNDERDEVEKLRNLCIKLLPTEGDA